MCRFHLWEVFEQGLCCLSFFVHSFEHSRRSEVMSNSTIKAGKEVSPKGANVASTKAAAGCCGGAPKENTAACCVADEEAKASGQEGCGCNTDAPKAGKASSCCG